MVALSLPDTGTTSASANVMLARPTETFHEDLPQRRTLTEEEDREMKKNLARKNFNPKL
ncbi:MAG: hypothetical protein OXM03_01890 [Chloroflexota bacterium]|nr:hypothetical protein [Chloroflexota bacterium]